MCKPDNRPTQSQTDKVTVGCRQRAVCAEASHRIAPSHPPDSTLTTTLGVWQAHLEHEALAVEARGVGPDRADEQRRDMAIETETLKDIATAIGRHRVPIHENDALHEGMRRISHQRTKGTWEFTQNVQSLAPETRPLGPAPQISAA